MARILLGNIKGPKGDRGPAGEDGRKAPIATTTQSGLISKEYVNMLEAHDLEINEIKKELNGYVNRHASANYKISKLL